MKKLSLVAGFAFVLLLPASSPGAPLACAPASLADYEALASDGCTIGGLRFFEFAALPAIGSAVGIASVDILVTPLAGQSPGLLFDVGTTALDGEIFQARIAYSVDGRSLLGASLSMTGDATGFGASTVVEDICADGGFVGGDPTTCTGTPATLITVALDGLAVLDDALPLGPAAVAAVISDIVIDGGPFGTAQIGTVANRFDVIPEPGTLLLVGAGACAARWRRRRVRS